jgi:hypothetical protein
MSFRHMQSDSGSQDSIPWADDSLRGRALHLILSRQGFETLRAAIESDPDPAWRIPM